MPLADTMKSAIKECKVLLSKKKVSLVLESPAVYRIRFRLLCTLGHFTSKKIGTSLNLFQSPTVSNSLEDPVGEHRGQVFAQIVVKCNNQWKFGVSFEIKHFECRSRLDNIVSPIFFYFYEEIGLTSLQFGFKETKHFMSVCRFFFLLIHVL